MPRMLYHADGSKHVTRDDFETPRELFARLKGLFHITLDAAGAGNKHKHRCPAYLTDAFNQRWRAPRLGYGTIFANPPGSQLKGRDTNWVKRAIDAASAGERVLLLTPANTGSRWFKLIWKNADAILFFDRRIRYELDGVPQGTASFDSALSGFNLGKDLLVRFKSLKDLGTITLACWHCRHMIVGQAR